MTGGSWLRSQWLPAGPQGAAVLQWARLARWQMPRGVSPRRARPCRWLRGGDTHAASGGGRGDSCLRSGGHRVGRGDPRRTPADPESRWHLVCVPRSPQSWAEGRRYATPPGREQRPLRGAQAPGSGWGTQPRLSRAAPAAHWVALAAVLELVVTWVTVPKTYRQQELPISLLGGPLPQLLLVHG